MCISDVHAKSNWWEKLVAVLKSAETSKKKKYLWECQSQQQHFTPLVYLAEGMPSRETRAAEERLASALAVKLERMYSRMAAWVRQQMWMCVKIVHQAIPPPPRHPCKTSICWVSTGAGWHGHA